jgi:hypothetical protein
VEDTSSSEVVSSSVPEDRTLEEIVGGLGDFGVESAEMEKFAGMCFAFEGLFVGVAVDVDVEGIGYEGFCKEGSNMTDR